ncbi:MAG: hypothetical protein ACQETY_11215 [Pseudomonadota bacterium]
MTRALTAINEICEPIGQAWFRRCDPSMSRQTEDKGINRAGQENHVLTGNQGETRNVFEF